MRNVTVFEMNDAIENAFKGVDKYAIYLRKSRADLEAEKDGAGETLAKHRRILTDLAARKGLYVEEIYEEIVSGADSIDDRKEIKRLIEDCYNGKYTGILVMAVDRLSRGSSADGEKILTMLKHGNRNKGVLVVTPTKTYDVAHRSDDEEYMEFELFMSRREYKIIKRRLDSGKLQAVVEGNYMGSKRLYGFNIEETRHSRYLVPHPEEAPVVKMIYQWASEGLSTWKIATKLESMGVPTIGGGEWSPETIRGILTNVHYIGKVKWFDHVRVKSMVGGILKTKIERKTEKYMEFEGKHDPLIDEETFANVQNRFNLPKVKRNYDLKNALAGLMFCEKCGKAMRYQNSPHARPRFVHPTSKRCKVKSALVDDVMSAVVESLKMHIEDFELRVDNKPLVDESSVRAQISALEAEQKKLNHKKMKLFDEWDEVEITPNEFAERKAYLNEKIETVKSQIKELESAIPEQEEYQDKIIRLHEALDMLIDDSIDAETKNEYLKRIIRTIKFSRENDYEFILDVFLT
jgi:DNA invertase Pin-like site-specific DNA recombinase